MTIEYRELRGSVPSEGDQGSFSGRTMPFDTETQIGPSSWGWKEKFNRNAFNKFLREGDTCWLDQHDSHKPVARVSAGTLAMTKRNGGLEWDSTPTSTASWVADCIATIRAGNYGGCSVGFEVVREAWTDDKGEPSDQYDGTHREVLEAKLPEFSTVTFPAYGDTSVQQNGVAGANELLDIRKAQFEARTSDVVREGRAESESAQPEGEQEERESAPACAVCAERAAHAEETPAPEAEENSEPVPTTREIEEDPETALRLLRFAEFDESRMLGLEE